MLMSPKLARGKKEDAGRRRFLKSAVSGISILLGLLYAAGTALSLLPKAGTRRKTAFIALIDEDDAPRRGVREVPYTISRDGREVRGKILLARAPAGLIALSPACTHLGCHVTWHDEEGEFICPCHGGHYDISGRNIDGPPPAPLLRFPVERREGMIHVEVPT
jgi:cytochrome b6-f complex iron-sulfur subunit